MAETSKRRKRSSKLRIQNIRVATKEYKKIIKKRWQSKRTKERKDNKKSEKT